MGSSSPSCSRPSTVRTSWPLAIAASMVQLFTGVPSTWTTQTPQFDVSQPQCVPVRPRSSRRKCTSSRLGSISRVYCSPFTVTVTCMNSPLLSTAAGDRRSQCPLDQLTGKSPFVIGGPTLVAGRLTLLCRHLGGQLKCFVVCNASPYGVLGACGN